MQPWEKNEKIDKCIIYFAFLLDIQYCKYLPTTLDLAWLKLLDGKHSLLF